MLVASGAANAAAQDLRPTTARDLRELHDFARCVALGRPERVRQLFALDPLAPDTPSQLQRVVLQANGCTSGRLAATDFLFIGALAESMIPRDLRGRSLELATRYNPDRPALQARDAAEFMGMCLIRAAPADVAAIFSTAPGGASERDAVARLQPQLASCLPAGRSAALNRQGLRASLAGAAYRLIQHNMAAPNAAVERR
jgi:hypothetical protein